MTTLTWKSERKWWATSISASFGHFWNQSITEPDIKPGNFSARLLNFSPTYGFKRTIIRNRCANCAGICIRSSHDNKIIILKNAVDQDGILTGEKQSTICKFDLERIIKYSYNTSGTGILLGAYFFIMGVNSFSISSENIPVRVSRLRKINYTLSL